VLLACAAVFAQSRRPAPKGFLRERVEPLRIIRLCVIGTMIRSRSSRIARTCGVALSAKRSDVRPPFDSQ
jgi:hypothetical protein